MAGDSKAFTIPAGGTYPINGNGETYIFCQFADRPIRVKIAGKTVTMRAGGYQEFEPLAGPNARVEFENTDPDNPAAVVFIMGTGTYDEKIIRGEVSVTPVLRSADGTTKPDTRQLLQIDVLPRNLVTKSYAIGDVVNKSDPLKGMKGDPESSVDDSNCWVFPGPNGTIVFHTYVAGFTTGGMNFYNKELKLVDQNDYAPGIPGNTTPYDVLWCPQYGYLSAAYGVDGLKIYQYQNDNTRELFDTFEPLQRMTSWCFIPGKNQFAIHTEDDPDLGDAILILDIGLNVLRKYAVQNIGAERLRYNEFNDELWLFSTSQLRRYRLSDDAFIEPQISQLWGQDSLSFGGVADRNTLVITTDAENPTSLRRVAAVDYVTKPEFSALRNGCNAAHYINRKPGRAPQISADITVSESPEAVTISGEVIKAAIESYFGRKAPDDYLDHVYTFDVSNGALGQAFKPISSGNETFKAAAVVDDFSIQAPGQILMTIDNEMTLGGVL